MTNYPLTFFLIFTIPYATIIALKDLKHRKVPNTINLSFLYFSFLIFCFCIPLYTFVEYLIIIVSFLISYFLYKKGIWGGADGKIFLGIMFLIMALGDDMVFLSFFVNLIFLYLLIMFILILLKTKLKDKIKVAKSIEYSYVLFNLLIVFLFVKPMTHYLSFLGNNIMIFVLIAVFVLMKVVNSLTKKFYLKINKFYGLTLCIVLAVILYYISGLIILPYFIGLYAFRISTGYIGTIVEYIRNDDGTKYYSPFALYLFSSVIISFIFETNIVLVVRSFF